MISNDFLASTLLNMQKIIFHTSLGRERANAARLLYVRLQSFLRPDLSLEIGAHEAMFSQLMRADDADLDIIACEANPAVHTHYKSRINFTKQKIAYINKAVSDRDGEVEFNVPDEGNNLSVRSSILNRDYSIEGITSQKIKVNSVQGDTLIESFNAHNAAVWIDVEGAAGLVLKGLKNSLENRHISSMFIEVETYAYWEEQQLEHHVLKTLLDYGYVPILCDGEYTYQQNILFVKKEYISEQFFAAVHEAYTEVVQRLFQDRLTAEQSGVSPE